MIWKEGDRGEFSRGREGEEKEKKQSYFNTPKDDDHTTKTAKL